MTSADVTVGPDGVARCWWCGDDPLYVDYHDREWGMPLRDERALFELLCLEGFQPSVVAGFGDAEVERLLADARIVRHRGKITAMIGNAGVLAAMHEAGASLVQVVWSHAPPPRPAPLRHRGEIPAETPESVAVAKELKRQGFRFVGPTTVYAFMQAAGLVDDHLEGCHRAGAGAGLRRRTPR